MNRKYNNSVLFKHHFGIRVCFRKQYRIDIVIFIDEPEENFSAFLRNKLVNFLTFCMQNQSTKYPFSFIQTIFTTTHHRILVIQPI